MRVLSEKSKFLRESVEFLGFLVSKNGIKTCPDKVADIINYKLPTTLRGLRSFLGLAGYYRRFVKDYANITKPLTKYLRGENGNVNAKTSKNVQLELDKEALKAFNKVKEILASEDVLLLQPDYDKPFELTTDASSTAIGAVLSQQGRPITMISRTLSKTEENYATNERELLAVVWALQKLRNYLYGAKNINIFSDHQPLSFSLSERNPNTKIRRWRAFIEEFSPKFFFKPGKENTVADALSRQYANPLFDYELNSNRAERGSETDSASEGQSTITASEGQSTLTASEGTIHSEESLTNVIRIVKNPVNCFKNQIILNQDSTSHMSSQTLFECFTRHLINFSNIDDIYTMLKKSINPNVVNCIHCDIRILGQIQNNVVAQFTAVKIVYSNKIVIDVSNPNDQIEILVSEHNRAHRNAHENSIQVLQDYFFPNIKRQLKTIVANCKTCSESKYNRRPKKVNVGQTPIPSNPGEILHIDIFSTDNQHFLSCLDKFTKFAIILPINSRSILDVKIPLLKIVNFFPNAKTIICDNEKAFNSQTIKSLLANHFGIKIFPVPPAHSVSNGQVERLHSTIGEIARCLKNENTCSDTIELVLIAVSKYNDTVHSVTGHKPSEIIHSLSKKDRDIIKSKITQTQISDLFYHNQKRTARTFKPDDEVFVKVNRRLGNKFSKLYVKKTVQKDLGTSLQIDNRVVHKDNIK